IALHHLVETDVGRESGGHRVRDDFAGPPGQLLDVSDWVPQRLLGWRVNELSRESAQGDVYTLGLPRRIDEVPLEAERDGCSVWRQRSSGRIPVQLVLDPLLQRLVSQTRREHLALPEQDRDRDRLVDGVVLNLAKQAHFPCPIATTLLTG